MGTGPSIFERKALPSIGSGASIWEIVLVMRGVVAWSDQQARGDIFLLCSDVSNGKGHSVESAKEACTKGMDQV